jgi:rusticyanin
MAQARRHMAARPPTDQGEHGWEMLHRRRSLGAVVTLGIALLPLAHGLSQGPLAGPKPRETVQVISPAAARALARKTAATALVTPRARLVTYTGARVELVAMGSPPGNPDETWNIAGMVNPTVHIHTGAQVTVHFFNADADKDTWHGWLLTTARPPYPRQVAQRVPLAFPGAGARPVHGETAHRWFGRTVHFIAARAGTYYYLCQVPGHARMGMYGELVVR